MIPLVMNMLHILRQRMAERRFPKEDQPRETFLLDRSHPAFRVGVQIGRPRRQWHTCHPGCVDDLVKGRAVFPVPVMDQVLPGRQEASFLHRDMAGALHHPLGIGMGCHARDMDSPAAQMHETQDVMRHEPTQRPDLSGEEVCRDHRIQMRADTLLPCGGRLTLWSR
jgi:hypothetical protein